MKKWVLIGLVLVLVIGWSVGCKERSTTIIYDEPPPYFKHQINEFLDKILNRIVQEVPYSNDHYFSIKSVFNTSDPCLDWAGIDEEEEKIKVNKRLILFVKNEAELAYVIAHEVSHVVILEFLPKSLWPWQQSDEINKRFYSYPSFIMVRYPPYKNILSWFSWLWPKEHALVDHVGIELMAKIGYNTYSAVDIAQRWGYDERRLDVVRQSAGKYFQESQKKWILTTPEELEIIRSFCRMKTTIRK